VPLLTTQRLTEEVCCLLFIYLYIYFKLGRQHVRNIFLRYTSSEFR